MSPVVLYPLRFRPLFRQYLWGGRRLGEQLGKAIGPEPHYAESWELVDHGGDQSIVSHGPLAGLSLHALVVEHGRELLGRHHPVERFPLLFKFLDAAQPLSVQVHPNDAQAALLSPPDYGKTEAWVILAAEPGSYLCAGLRPGVDRATLARQTQNGASEQCIHRLTPKTGDCIFLPAGVVHAIGPGLLVAEIQQSSDTTYRLFDWNRVGADGKPRELHVEQALEVIDYDRGPVAPQSPVPLGEGQERLVECDKFVLERRNTHRPFAIGGDDRFRILAVLDGTLSLPADAAPLPLARGDVALIPASVGRLMVEAHSPTTMLEMYMP